MNKLFADPRRLYLAMGLCSGVVLGIYLLALVVWWVVDLELSPLRLILLGTVLEVAVLAAESPTGVVADSYSRKWSIVVSWVIGGVAQLLMAATTSLGLLLVWQALWGIGYTFRSGADTAWVTDELGQADDSLVMSRAVATSTGLVIGLTIGAGLTQWSLTGTVAVTGVMALIIALVLAVGMPEKNFTPAARDAEAGLSARLQTLYQTWRRGLSVITGKRILRSLVVVTVLVASVDEMVDSLDLARIRELGFSELDGSETALGFAVAWIAMTLLTIPTMLVVARRLDGGTDRRSASVMGGFLLLGATGIGLMAGPVVVLAVIGWVMRDVIREVVDPVGEAWINRHAPSEVRATVISFRSQSMASGEVLGGLTLGLVAEFVGLSVAFAVGAALLAAAGLVVLRLIGGYGSVGDPNG